MWRTLISRLPILALAVLASDPAFGDAQVELMRPVETSCGMSVFAFSRVQMTSSHMAPNFLSGRCYSFAPIDDAPLRGDVVTFPHADAIHVMRLTGLPGDTVELRAGIVMLNGAPLVTRPYTGERHACGETECDGRWLVESLPDGPSYLVLDSGNSRYDDTAPFIVPDGQVFVLGDNRDNSADSRISVDRFGMGFVALDSLRRVARVME